MWYSYSGAEGIGVGVGVEGVFVRGARVAMGTQRTGSSSEGVGWRLLLSIGGWMACKSTKACVVLKIIEERRSVAAVLDMLGE